MKKQRIDEWLVEREYFDTKDEAMRYIMAGKVFNGHERIHSAGERIKVESAMIRVKGLDKKYVSRGGFKLEKAVNTFQLDLHDKVHMDVGSSTGGFTDCALQHGAQMSYAIDVGTNQLAYSLRTDPRVVVMEKTNFRYVTPADLPTVPDFATVDVSFISLKHILPGLNELLSPDGQAVVLIKPQFEAHRDEVGDKGIVADPAVHMNVIQSVLNYAENEHLYCHGLTDSPIKGAAGNTEYLLLLRRQPHGQPDQTFIHALITQALTMDRME